LKSLRTDFQTYIFDELCDYEIENNKLEKISIDLVETKAVKKVYGGGTRKQTFFKNPISLKTI
jgi:hypothetical protein